jgi:hypothetical protein
MGIAFVDADVMRDFDFSFFTVPFKTEREGAAILRRDIADQPVTVF